LGYTAATTAAALFGPTIGSWAKSFVDTPQAGWYDKPMRWAQIGFAEDDPGNYDPQFWLDYFKRLHVEAVTLNAGGAVRVLSHAGAIPLPQQVAGQHGYLRRSAEELPDARHGRGRAD